MDIKGVCYDVGRVYGGRFLTRPVFEPAATRRELRIIRNDLHCNAVRFQGRDITRLMTAAAGALGLGLQVWLSPELFEQSRETTLAYLVQAATAAEPLRQRFPGRLVFCVGTESSLFTRGIVPGRSVGQRVANIRTAGLRSSPYAGPLQAFLAEASQRVRPVFHGPLTYASTPFEVVDWSLFDVIGVDHYRNSKVEDHRYAETIRRYPGQGKPVVNSEFGHSAYRGDRPGLMEFGEVDTGSLALHRVPLAGRLVRPRLKKGSHLRDEGHPPAGDPAALRHLRGRRGRSPGVRRFCGLVGDYPAWTPAHAPARGPLRAGRLSVGIRARAARLLQDEQASRVGSQPATGRAALRRSGLPW